jgi:hypothetical protein
VNKDQTPHNSIILQNVLNCKLLSLKKKKIFFHRLCQNLKESGPQLEALYQVNHLGYLFFL